MTPRLEKDTSIEGDEMLSHEELNAALDASIREISESRTGRSNRRITVVTDNGEMLRMTQEEYHKNYLSVRGDGMADNSEQGQNS